MPNLREKVTGPVEGCLGHELREVWYKSFGDGDNVLVRTSDSMIDLSDWDLLWSGSAA